MSERRRGEAPVSAIDYLQRMPALLLLDRLSTPVIAADSGGGLTYANSAFAGMLGYSDLSALTGRPISALMSGRADRSAQECFSALSTARGSLVEWRHADGYAVQTLVSDSMLLRSTDPLLLVSVSDMTEWVWTNRKER